MEEFQGQEKMVIMVSAVRSSNSYVKMDQDFNIGFLTNEKVYPFLSCWWGSFNKKTYYFWNSIRSILVNSGETVL